MSKNALQLYENGGFEMIQRTGTALATSGLFSDAKQTAQAIVKVMAGAELGLPPFTSMTGIHIIQGKPALGANVIATLIKNDPRYDYQVKTMSENLVEIDFFEGGNHSGVSSFSLQDAKRAGTKNLDKFPRNMLFARAISNGARWYTPGVFGGAPVYTPEELGASVDEEGYIIEGEVVEAPHEQKVDKPAPAPQAVTQQVTQAQPKADTIDGVFIKQMYRDGVAEKYGAVKHMMNTLDKHCKSYQDASAELTREKSQVFNASTVITKAQAREWFDWLVEYKQQENG